MPANGDELNQTDEGVAEESVETLRQALADEKAKAEQYLASWQRAQADFINYKRRTEQEKSETTVSANSALTLKVLPAIDDMERAFRKLPPDPEEHAWVEGFRLIYRKLKNTLVGQGLEEIEAEGKPFDPHLMEAVGYEEDREEDVVLHETQKGYKFCGRVLRPALVVVGKGKTGNGTGIK
ncbi:MAG: nucleotide exchange factor GrpE [Chloroflexi bacterium]|nr:nucleotide exchange factor GrpE [Chloroflexota bacterium]